MSRPSQKNGPGAPLHRARLWSPTAFALGGIVALLIAVEIVSFVYTSRRHQQLHSLVGEMERSTFLLGDVGQLLSRFQVNVLEALTEPADEVQVARERIQGKDGIELRLDARIAEVPSLLSGHELPAWEAMLPKIASVRDQLTRALDTIEEGRREEAEDGLDKVVQEIRPLFEELKELVELNQVSTAIAMRDVDRLMARARWLQMSLGLLLTLAIGGIAWQTLRVLRRREHEIDLHVERVERANRDLEAFAGRVAHDLRNVLAPLPVCAQALELEGGDRGVVRDTAQRIERVARRATDLISGLLAFARAGGSTANARCAVGREVEAVLEELAPEVRRLGARVEVEVEPELAVACDASLLHVVLLNLISNAVKFLEGGERREVRVRARAEGERCWIEVEDTGPGIPVGLLEHVFEPFFRAPGAGAGGDGIGLATVSRVVEAHGGEARAVSTVGVGSTFRVALPRAASAPAARDRVAVGAARA